ncbi:MULTISPECIES: 30S ribosomal protein S20 [Mesotoga]|uniref:Small ribosomal subunit protein bS20 n=2 Tax=Mesotoga prima TaxID=1184387 RepID=I2F3N7_9BACT|nr:MULTISPECIES: 30S ribosomal protein S20 [Mesotoga]MCP5456821.1 30S ribosomal protein S20 [Thermotogota bacterium]CCU86082.1 30S ribosomal protein S20 [Mesotoga infera]AFK06540.1 ribosomal protein S20 [Mesotoga prima MesG1.Ag.4.2]MCB1223226.1 30S ribosomal protein S20 [Mesotoga sp.]MCP5460998.1 30S ribosomal protein S20 [Thermotogota bacterium]
MPNNASAKKRVRQTAKKTMMNKAVRTKFRNASKKLYKAIEEGEDPKLVSSMLSEVYSTLDKAAKSGTIHKNTASRKKARLTSKVKTYVETRG